MDRDKVSDKKTFFEIYSSISWEPSTGIGICLKISIVRIWYMGSKGDL
jgi:hypothetical protein